MRERRSCTTHAPVMSRRAIVTAIARLQPATTRLNVIACSGYPNFVLGAHNSTNKQIAKKCGCLHQMFKMMSIRLHACTHEMINGLVDDALQNASPRIRDSLLQVVDVVISLQSKIK